MNIPFTYYYDFDTVNGDWLPIMEEFAANGAKHLVFSELMVGEIARTPAFRRTLMNNMETAGLTFVDGHCQFSAESTLIAPPELRAQVLARAVLTLQIMADAGVKTCCYHVGNLVEYPEMKLSEGQDNIKRALALLIPEAEKRGIVLGLENIFHPTHRTEFLLELMDEFGGPYVGLCYDCAHANIMQNPVNDKSSVLYSRWISSRLKPEEIKWETDVLEVMLPHIVMCHLHDNNALLDQHNLPGRGNIDFDTMLKKLITAPRLMSMQSEVTPAKNQISIAELCSTWQNLTDKL